jgi:hypothetical protein
VILSWRLFLLSRLNFLVFGLGAATFTLVKVYGVSLHLLVWCRNTERTALMAGACENLCRKLKLSVFFPLRSSAIRSIPIAPVQVCCVCAAHFQDSAITSATSSVFTSPRQLLSALPCGVCTTGQWTSGPITSLKGKVFKLHTLVFQVILNVVTQCIYYKLLKELAWL